MYVSNKYIHQYYIKILPIILALTSVNEHESNISIHSELIGCKSCISVVFFSIKIYELSSLLKWTIPSHRFPHMTYNLPGL